MFNRDQSQRWRRAVERNEDVRTSYLGHRLGEAPLTFEAKAEPGPGSPRQIGKLKTPACIFGVPYDGSCLNGIGNAVVDARSTDRLRLRNARVVGYTAVLAEDNRLFTPHDTSLMEQEVFLRHNASSHNNFLLEKSGDSVLIRFVQREQPRRYRQSAVFLYDAEPGNYGSFIVRQLPQMMYLRDADIQFDCYISSDRTLKFMEALNLLRLPNKPVYSAKEVAGDFFDSIYMFRYDDAEGFLAPDYRDSLRRLGRNIAGTNGASVEASNFYVSRSLSALWRPSYRVMTNEAEVEAAARAAGFAIIWPETLSLSDQIRAFSGARLLLGPSGSGMLNVAFASHPARIVDIETFTTTVRQHAKLYSSCGADYAFLFSTLTGDENQSPIIRPSVCPMELLDQAIAWLRDGRLP